MAISKKKKRKKLSGQQKKQHSARALNEYYQRTVKFAASCGLLETLNEIPKTEINNLLKKRIDGFIVEAEDETKPGRKFIKEILNYLDEKLNNTTFKILPEQDPVTLYDFFTVGWNLHFIIYSYFNLSSQPNSKIEERLIALKSCYEKNGGSGFLLGKIFFSIVLFISTFNKGYYHPELTHGKQETGLHPFYIKIKLHYFPPEIIEIEEENKKRPVYRVGWVHGAGEIRWAGLPPRDLNIDFFAGDFKLPVYIQSHALKRLEERLDCIGSSSVLQFMLHEAVRKPKIKIVHDKTILLEYIYQSIKLGYLVLDVIEGIVVIRTFLFLTADDTPEGQKLRELAGFNKLDKKYWAMDKLGTFFSEDLRSNKQACELFKAAGCGKLLEMELEGLQNFWKEHSNNDFADFMDQVQHYKYGFDFNSGQNAIRR